MIQINWEYIHDVALDGVGNISRLNSEMSVSNSDWAVFSFYLARTEVEEVVFADLYLNVITAQASQALDIGRMDYLNSSYDCWAHSWGNSRFIIEEESFGLYVESSNALQTTGDHWIELGSLACRDVETILRQGGFFGIFLKGNSADEAVVASVAYSSTNARPKLRIRYR